MSNVSLLCNYPTAKGGAQLGRSRPQALSIC
jgi:hypothetical protein